jgi:hypothetical protein
MEDKKPAKKSNEPKKPDFSGRLNSICASKSGAQFQFEVVNKKDECRSYQLDSGNSSGFSVMASFVTAAYVAGKKVTVIGTQNGGGVSIATEVRLGAKPKASKEKAQTPAKRIKGPVTEVQPAA